MIINMTRGTNTNDREKSGEKDFYHSLASLSFSISYILLLLLMYVGFGFIFIILVSNCHTIHTCSYSSLSVRLVMQVTGQRILDEWYFL